jgi:hypothetical protein
MSKTNRLTFLALYNAPLYNVSLYSVPLYNVQLNSVNVPLYNASIYNVLPCYVYKTDVRINQCTVVKTFLLLKH